MFTYPFEILKKRLTDTITELREVDWFMDQISDSDKNSKIKTCPAVFIEFITPEMRHHSGTQIQSGITDFIVHLITEQLSDKGSVRLKKSAAKDHMALYDKIYKNLHGFSALISYLPDFAILLDTSQDQRIMNSIARVNPEPSHKVRKGLMHSAQRFRCVVYDHAAAIEYTTPVTTLELTTEVNYEPQGLRTFDDTFDDTLW